MIATIDWIGGNCPVQAEGQIDGFGFYFRARGSHWSFEVLDGSADGWLHVEKYGDGPYDAGWMTEDDARGFIEKASLLFRNRSGDADDGQPTEREEWHDFDPDC